MTRRRLFLLFLLLAIGRLAFAPAAQMPAVLAQTDSGKLNGSGEDLFAPFTPQEMVSGRTLHRTLPPLTRREIIVWSFRAAPPGPFQ